MHSDWMSIAFSNLKHKSLYFIFWLCKWTNIPLHEYPFCPHIVYTMQLSIDSTVTLQSLYTAVKLHIWLITVSINCWSGTSTAMKKQLVYLKQGGTRLFEYGIPNACTLLSAWTQAVKHAWQKQWHFLPLFIYFLFLFISSPNSYIDGWNYTLF